MNKGNIIRLVRACSRVRHLPAGCKGRVTNIDIHSHYCLQLELNLARADVHGTLVQWDDKICSWLQYNPRTMGQQLATMYAAFTAKRKDP
jgi:hypothetical protein